MGVIVVMKVVRVHLAVSNESIFFVQSLQPVALSWRRSGVNEGVVWVNETEWVQRSQGLEGGGEHM